MPSPDSKVVKFRQSDHEIIEEVRLEISMERGISNLSIPQLVMEAVKFFRENRPKS